MKLYFSELFNLKKFTSICRLPFEWRAPIPYIATSLFLYSIALYGTIMFIVTISLYIGFCVYGIAFVHDIQLNLQSLNADVINEHKNLTTEKRIKIKEQFCDIIRFHIDAKQLSEWYWWRLRIIISNTAIYIFRLITRFSELYHKPFSFGLIIVEVAFCTIFLQLDLVNWNVWILTLFRIFI